MTPPCEKCACPCNLPPNDYGELICRSCTENAEEAAYDRHMESFHDGGATQWKTLQEQQIDLWGLK